MWLALLKNPLTKIIAEKLDLQYEEFSDVGISNEAIFRL